MEELPVHKGAAPLKSIGAKEKVKSLLCYQVESCLSTGSAKE